MGIEKEKVSGSIVGRGVNKVGTEWERPKRRQGGTVSCRVLNRLLVETQTRTPNRRVRTVRGVLMS